MADINEPNYVHYSRLKTINLDEAASLLAHFGLKDKNVTDPDEYAQLFNEEKLLANQVLYDANMRNSLDCFREDGIPSDIPYNYYGGYDSRIVKVNVIDFCMWATNQKYNLPNELLEASGNEKGDGERTESQRAAVGFQTEVVQQEVEADNGGGRPDGTLAEAVRCTYEKLLLNDDEKWRLKKGHVRDFIEFLKFMATPQNQHADKEVMELIDSVKTPYSGDCTIKTQERRDLILKGKSKGVSKTYKNRDVTKILMRLREKSPFPE
jgi:hypothetical protein